MATTSEISSTIIPEDNDCLDMPGKEFQCRYYSIAFDFCNKYSFLKGILFTDMCRKTCNLCPGQQTTSLRRRGSTTRFESSQMPTEFTTEQIKEKSTEILLTTEATASIESEKQETTEKISEILTGTVKNYTFVFAI